MAGRTGRQWAFHGGLLLLVTWPNRVARKPLRDAEADPRHPPELRAQARARRLRLRHAATEQMLLRVAVRERGDEPVRDDEDRGAGVELRVREELPDQRQPEVGGVPHDVR